MLGTVAQRGAMARFVENPAITDMESAAAEYLLQSPLDGFSISSDGMRAAWMLRVQCAANAVSDSLLVPNHFLEQEQIVLGEIFTRTPIEFPDEVPVDLSSGELSPKVKQLDSTGRYLTSVTRFAFHLPSAQLVHVEETVNGSFSVYDFVLREHGFSDIRGAFVEANGHVGAVEFRPKCQYCAGRPLGSSTPSFCSCPSSLRQRMAGSTLSFTNWTQLLEFGCLRGVPTNCCEMSPIEGYESAINGQFETVWSLHFDGEHVLADIRSCFLENYTTRGLRVERSVIEWDLESIEPLEDLRDFEMRLEQIREPVKALEDETGHVPCGDTGQNSKKSSTSRKYKCGECGTLFAKASNRNRHLAAAHNGQPKYQCEICGCKFAQLSNLKRHVTQVHYKQTRQECPLCRITVTNKANLLRHIRSRHSAS